MNDNTAKGLYSQLESLRDTYLQRAREAALLTIPYLVPPSGHSSHTHYSTPYQSVGSRGVNNLASRLILSLFPTNAPFFRFAIDQGELNKALEEMEDEEMAAQFKTELDIGLSKVERSISQEIEVEGFRSGAFEALKQLLVAGNVLIYIPEDGGLRVFRLDRYVVKRDPMGNITHIVTKETVAAATLSPELQQLIGDETGKDDTIDLYTAIVRDGKGYMSWQELGGTKIPDSEGKYDDTNMPWMALRYTRIDGEAYGRGFVEEYQGDLQSLEGLTKALVQGSAAAAKVLFLVNPNGTTRAKDLAEAPNGGFVDGIREDISTLQMEKFNDFRVVQTAIGQIEERLSHAFLLNSSVIRNAERVTAEEIRMVAQELEAALGGLYSLLSQELQMPIVKRLISKMTKQKRLPKLPKEVVKPTITTGVEALGRGNDLNKLDMFVAGVGQVMGPEVVATYLVPGEYLRRRGAAVGIDTNGLVKTDDQLQQEQQQQQQMQAMMQLGKPAIDSATKQMMQAQEIDQQQQEG